MEIVGRQTAVVDQHLRESNRAERCLAGRLQHHWATGGDGRRQLVSNEVQREVERRDRADNADGHAQREAELAFAGCERVEWHHLARQLARFGRGELKRADGTLCFAPCGLDRLCWPPRRYPSRLAPPPPPQH